MKSTSLLRLAWFAAATVFLFVLIPCLDAQTSGDQASEPQSWIKTTESQIANTNPTRTTESHKKSDKGAVDSQTVERLGADGHYEPYYDIEKESVQVNGSTVRTIERTFARDASGQRILTQVTEEEKQSLPSGGEKLVRTTSNANLDGHLQVAQREVTNTKKISPEVQEKNTTVFLSDGQGGMSASVQIQQREKRSADHTVQVQTSTLLPDGSGNWQVHERKESTVKEDGIERTTEEQISRPDVEGKLAPISRTVGKESETASGEKKSSIETYSPDIAGSAQDSNLHLSQRVTTSAKRVGTDGAQATEKRVEQVNPTDPGAGMQETTRTFDTVKSGASGTQATSTVEARDVSGSFSVVSFDTQKSDNVHSVDVDIAPQNKNK